MKVTGYYVNSHFIANSDGVIKSEKPFLDFLLADNPETIKAFYHLDYCAANLLRLISANESQLRMLNKANRVMLPPYTLKYVPRKFFSIKHGLNEGGNEFTVFSDVAQYLTPKLEPDDSPEYAIGKAKEAQRVGQEVYDSLVNLGLSPSTIISPISAWEKEKISGLPTIDDIPSVAAEYAYECTHGGWLEAFKKGHFEKAYDFDIRSAYSSFTSELLDPREGRWERNNNYNSNAFYGYCKCTITIESGFSPIFFGSKEQTFTPVGTWEGYLTKQEIDFIVKHNLGDVVIHDAWWWTPRRLVRPLKEMIHWLHAKKESSLGMQREVTKRVMEGVWGATLRIDDGVKFGPWFNPVWGAQVESSTRLKVAEFCMPVKDKVLHIAVDGVVLSEPVPISGDGMGTWKLTNSGPTVVISSGIIAMQGKSGKNDFSLDYDKLTNQIKDNPKAGSYSMTKLSPMTLAKACQQNHLDRLGELEEITKTVDITYEMKRCYRKAPRTGGQLLKNQYDSSPWDVSVIQ